MTPTQERYYNDPEFHALVDMLENFIAKAKFSPSELREAATQAAINYEYKHLRYPYIPKENADDHN